MITREAFIAINHDILYIDTVSFDEDITRDKFKKMFTGLHMDEMCILPVTMIIHQPDDPKEPQ